MFFNTQSNPNRPTSVAFVGFRGIPARYGGFETFAERLAPRLVKAGYDVRAYCRTNNVTYKGRLWRGVELVKLPTIPRKTLDTLAHTFISSLHLMLWKTDVVLMMNVGNAMFIPMLRLFGMKVLLNVDGLEWQRQKWGPAAKLFFKVSERIACWFANEIVTDAKVIQDYYQEKYGKGTMMIPYGADVTRKRDAKAVGKYDLKPNKYFLYVSRFEPENNAHKVVQAYENVKTDLPLVMVGDAPYNPEYVAQVKATKDPRIIFLGFVYGQDYKKLQQNAYAYIQATEVGGTHPALIEGMGYGNCVIANGTDENREVVSSAGLLYDNTISGLQRRLQVLADHPELRRKYQARAKRRISRIYTWDAVAEAYQNAFGYMLGPQQEKERTPVFARVSEI